MTASMLLTKPTFCSLAYLGLGSAPQPALQTAAEQILAVGTLAASARLPGNRNPKP